MLRWMDGWFKWRESKLENSCTVRNAPKGASLGHDCAPGNSNLAKPMFIPSIKTDVDVQSACGLPEKDYEQRLDGQLGRMTFTGRKHLEYKQSSLLNEHKDAVDITLELMRHFEYWRLDRLLINLWDTSNAEMHESLTPTIPFELLNFCLQKGAPIVAFGPVNSNSIPYPEQCCASCIPVLDALVY